MDAESIEQWWKAEDGFEYRFTPHRTPRFGWHARYAEHPDVEGVGKTPNEAVAMLVTKLVHALWGSRRMVKELEEESAAADARIAQLEEDLYFAPEREQHRLAVQADEAARQLGEWLTHHCDDDQFARAEQLLLAMIAEVERARRETEELRENHDWLAECVFSMAETIPVDPETLRRIKEDVMARLPVQERGDG